MLLSLGTLHSWAADAPVCTPATAAKVAAVSTSATERLTRAPIGIARSARRDHASYCDHRLRTNPLDALDRFEQLQVEDVLLVPQVQRHVVRVRCTPALPTPSFGLHSPVLPD